MGGLDLRMPPAYHQSREIMNPAGNRIADLPDSGWS